MDERHWWIAGKIQESFHIGGYDNPTLLEDFLCEPDTLELINQFLQTGGPRRIFFYCDKLESGTLSTRQLHIIGTLAGLREITLEDITILYFLRHKIDDEVDPNHMEKEVFCGELKGNTIDMLKSLLSEIFIPLLKAKKDWGHCSEENQSLFLQNMDKFVVTLTESSTGSHGSKQWMLRQPDSLVGMDFKQHRMAALDQQLVTDYEAVVQEWITTIDAIINDVAGDRVTDLNAGPMSELERWKRRHRLLTSITEQLKSKECKTVIGVLITGKSKLLKKWKLIDSGITDAMNETKDKVRYLESMKRHFEQLYNNPSLAVLMNTTLPGILNCVKQMDSVSRFYARQGFLGLLFSKITNQLVIAMKDHIKDCTVSADNADQLWDRVHEEVQHQFDKDTVDPNQRLLQTQLETKLKSVRLGDKKGRKDETSRENLLSRLKACLLLQSFYRDSIRSLRDSLGAAYNLSHFTSLSSLAGPPSVTGKSKMSPANQVPPNRQTARGNSSQSKKQGSVTSEESPGHGVSVADEEAIMAHMDTFCSRLRHVIDVINTMAQFHRMAKGTANLPRPRKEDLVVDESLVKEEARRKKLKEQDNAEQEQPKSFPKEQTGLGAIAEDEESKEDEENEEDREEDEKSHKDWPTDNYDLNMNSGLSREDVELLKKYYPIHQQAEGPSVMAVIEKHTQTMWNVMSQSVTTLTMLDVESKDQERFGEVYSTFLNSVDDLEKFLGAYLRAVFARKAKTTEALGLMSRFVPVHLRSGLRAVISEKFVEIFNWYESDLEEIQATYEKHKEDPPVLRNAPPVAGAIYWCRQLLKRIEEPMKIFRENRAVSGLKDFSRIVKMYNRLATALVTFESLWFTHWKSSIDHARNGLKVSLFVHHPDTKEILVNADEKVLELIQEAKWLTRLGMAIPDSAAQVMLQEARFKTYKDRLELCLQDFNAVLKSIRPSLRSLFQRHIDKVMVNFQPGVTTLAWNSMNIDAFLHQINTGTSKLQYLVERVNEILTSKVEDTIGTIRSMLLFDYNLAFSKSWPPEEFMESMADSIKGQSQKLNTYINTIEMGIRECATILNSRKTWSSQSREIMKSLDNISTSMMKSVSTNEEQQLIEDILEHYEEELYQAVLLAVTHSLVTLAESSGCEGEVIRAASVLSTSSSCRSSPRTLRPVSPSHSQSPTGTSEDRPVSILSMLSSMTWTTDKADEVTYLRFQVSVKFDIPNITVEPALNTIQNALNSVARNLLNIPQGIQWCGQEVQGDRLVSKIQEDGIINQIMDQLSNVVHDLEESVKQHLFHFSLYDFLWKDDMLGNYYDFIRHDPGMVIINREVERLLKVEQKVLSIPEVLPVGPICLQTDPIKDALHGFAMAWKSQYSSIMHEEAKRKLDSAVLYRSNVGQRLEVPVTNLDQLNSTALLLDELTDMENKIDDIYLPIETLYAKLRSFELPLARSEVGEVEMLRDKWQELLDLAEEVRQVLLKERRGAYEQELDKQVKTFVVEVIQFRNAFDAQGPSVPGIPPSEAVSRLQDFQQRFALYSTKRKTLDCVSKLFGIICKPFPELDKTGEELELLGLLYGLFQKFIGFDERFRETLWSEVDLDAGITEVESYWDECLALPSKLKDWDSYNDMKRSIQEYLDVFPLLHKLASKEIRNRHWLQVMAVTGSSFQLEANVFKLCHLLDIGLIRHRTEIEEICRSASRELELEVKLRMTEEEWTEQVLNFEHYKRRGPMYLDKVSTQHLLEQLEDAQALLAQMLTSRYIGPLREEAASWAEKLKEVWEVLEQWLEVQDLWQYLEAVFSNPDTAKELPQEAKRFARIDKGWTKTMKRAYDTRNVLQCCYGGEVPKSVVLRHIYEELEVCFKSLMGYLDNKRRAFPRFYFLTDPILLAVLSKPKDLDSVKPHLRSIFSAVYDIQLEQTNSSDTDSDWRAETELSHIEGFGLRKSMTPTERARVSSVMSSQNTMFGSGSAGTKIDKRLTAIHSRDRKGSDRQPQGVASKRTSHAYSIVPTSNLVNTMLPSEILLEESSAVQAMAVQSIEGEVLHLKEAIRLEGGVEVWLDNIQTTIRSSLENLIVNMTQDVASGVSCDEWALKYPTQVCQMGMLYYWTRECEQGVVEIKYDRKSLSNTSRKFGMAVGKLPVLLVRGSWKISDEAMTPVHKIRLEAMITQSLFLRDMIDNLSNRKLREPTDFEWRRCLRFYIHENDDKSSPQLCMLDQQYSYGCEFYGAEPVIGLTPMADKCYLSMSQAISQGKGAMVCGSTGAGKSETIKGFAQTLGYFLVTFHSCSSADATALGKLIQGLTMAGCWGCFENIHKLPGESLATLLDHIQAVLTALRSRQEYCLMGDGQEVCVDNKVAFFMTSNPHADANWPELPNDVRANFRQVSLGKPNLSAVLKAKCSSLGLKAPTVLAMRLKLVTELARDQLPKEAYHNFSVAAITGVLQRAGQRRRIMREEKSSDKMEQRLLIKQASFGQDDISRSNSQMSMAPSSFPIQQSSSQGKVGRKGGTPNPLPAAAKLEHALVGQMLLEIIGPRLTSENYVIFKQVVKDIFAGLPEPPMGSITAMHSTMKNFDVEAAIEVAVQEKGLVLHKPWLDKCLQLYSVSQVHQGIIVAGPPGSGKSSLVQTLVDALCVGSRGHPSRGSARSGKTAIGLNDANHKLQKIYPLVVDNLDLMFGYLNQNHDWVDGIFTMAWKKASRNQSTTWLCLDGPLNPSWVDTFSSVLDANKVLALANGDRLHLSSNMRLLFETDDLSQTSPSLIARTGVVFVDKNVVGWRPVAKAWLENRTQQEIHVLQRAFNKTVDAVSHYVTNDSKPKVQQSEVGMFQTCLGLLSAMLADNIEIGGELHIERLYLFCLMWSFGGLLEEKDKKGFNDLLSTLSTAFPDDDRDICFFDYYVDESGEWDPWHSRVPEAVYSDHDLLGRVFVDTVDTIRTRLLMEFACAAGQNILLVGSHGSGKTAMVNDFLDTQDPQKQITKRLVYSGSSCTQQLQQFIEANMYHRQGFVYGAKENKKLQLFIDDLNLPAPDENGVQRTNELLRRVLDDKVLCTLQKPFEWRTIEDLVVLTTMSMSQYPSMSSYNLAPRLLRHFAVFSLPAPQDESLKSIIQGVLETSMIQGERPGLEIDVHNALVNASCKVLQAVQLVLKPTPMPGRHHYLFTLKQLITCFQCLQKIPDESRSDILMVVSLWKHEMERLILDQVCRFPDQKWFEEIMQGIVNEEWPDLAESLHRRFVTFPVENEPGQQTVTSGPKNDAGVLHPIKNLQDVHSTLQSHLNKYNEEFGNEVLDIRLSENIIAHITKVHRILTYRLGGNILFVGQIGSHLGTLCKLALHVANIPIHPIDTRKQNTFLDGLRSAVRLTGAEGKKLAVFFTSRDLQDKMYLDAINSVLVSGEYPHLFTNDEIDGLLQVLGPAMKREHPTLNPDPHKFFVSRVMMNLHLIICLPPGHNLLHLAASQYPGLLTGCQLIWMADWAKEALMGDASYYVNQHKLVNDCDVNMGEAVVACLANIHSFVLQHSRQTKWAGDPSEEISLTQVKPHEKKKDQLKTVTLNLPNKPYSKTIMLENIKLHHRNLDVATSADLYCGPTTFCRFMDTFRKLYTQKAQNRTETVNRLKKVLATLDTTRHDAKVMKDSIKDIHRNYESAKKTTAQLLGQLTKRATVLEKLKAKVGIATSLSAFLQLNELSDEEEEETDLLKEEEQDEYDEEFDRMREANMRTRQVRVKEEYAEAIKLVDECQAKLAHAKEQVIHWRSRVDRQCIERVKAFQNPPMLIGQVMEMVMMLIGKRLPAQRLEPKELYSGKEEHSSRFSTSSSSTRMTANIRKSAHSRPHQSDYLHSYHYDPLTGKTVKDSNERFDRQSWKVMQSAMNDVVKFVDMLHNVSWEEGLPNEVTHAVEAYLAQSRDGQLGVTGEGTLLENAAEKEKSLVAIRRSPSPENSRGITIAAAKYSSEDVATLVQYTIAIVEYTHRCGPLKAALDKRQDLEREIEENERVQREKDNQSQEAAEPEAAAEPEEDLIEEDLPRIQADVDELQAQFDAAVVKKHALELDLQSTKERLKAATDMADSLKSLEKEWTGYVEQYNNNDILVANCVAAAAFLVYCGPLGTDTRKRMGKFFMTVCEHHKIPLPSKQLFKNMELANFLYTPIELRNLEQQRLPHTRLMLENAAFIMQGDNTMAWPLLSDPTSKVIDWITLYLQEQTLVKVRYTELKSQFDTCLADGLALLVTDVDVEALAVDKRFSKVLHSRARFSPGRNPFKMMVGDHEVECRPGFRLYLHTTSEPHLVPRELAAYVTTIYFHQTRLDIEEELLDRFMALEKSRINDDKAALLQEHLQNMEQLHDLEHQMVHCLSSDVHLLDDLATTKKLAELRKQYEEAVESQQRVDLNKESLTRAQEGYRIIAQRGAVCFDVIQYMREVDRLYQTSFSQFLGLYEAAISHSDRTPIKAVIERLTQSAFGSTVRALKEKDKTIFSLLLALEVEDANGNVGLGEREYLITPALGSVVMTTMGHTQPPESKFVTAKKTFDWMSDEQFNNLQILAIHYDWFQEMFDRMPKDGRETQWRTLCESEQPETQVLPDKMDDQYSPLQRLLVIRAVRSDRIMQLSTIFINAVLGKKYSGEIALDLPMVLRQSIPSTPILMLYTTERETAERAFHEFASKKQCKPLVVPLSGLGVGEEKMARKYLQKGMEEGLWVLLQNGHNSPLLLSSLESMFAESENIDPQFRCWITTEASKSVPIRCLQTCIKVSFDIPKSMKETMVRAFNWLDADVLRQSSRPEWPVLLHNLCYLHAAVRLRARLGRGGWNKPKDFLKIANSEFMEALQMVSQEFSDQTAAAYNDSQPVTRTISWTGMRFTLAEVIYGSYVTDPVDQYSLGAMIDYWISPNAVKRDFELAKLKYKHPAVFFSSHPRLSQLVQALENLPPYSLEVPEACNIHPSAETILGDDQYVFTRLNKVYDAMPSSDTLSHQLFPQLPTPFDGPPVTGVSINSNQPQIVNMGVFASAAFATLRMRKEVELWEICHTALSKVPRAYSKEYVAERIKKIGGMTPFNLFIMKELNQMYHLLTEIKNSLQLIKAACEVGSLGDQLSPSVLSVADDLYHMRLPELWCHLAGDTGPPLNHSLASWLSDLASRSQHFERILVLGREKMPAYWLGAFFQPRGLLAQLKQEAYRSHAQDRSGNIEKYVFQTEITARDKDHIRDPPAEGMFVFGIYMWGCAWEKTTGDLHDAPSKHNCSLLPVIHVTCWPHGEKPLFQDTARAFELYACPVFQSRISRKEPIMELDVQHNGIPATRWALRGLSATVRPY